MPSLMNNPKLVFIVFLSFISISSTAQNIALNYYSTGAGQNITANYSFDIKKSEIGIGLGYTINRSIHAPGNDNVYYKNQYATEPYQHLNLNLFYHRYIFPNFEHINIFVFYDFQGKYSTAYFKIGSGYFDNEEIRYHGPYFWLENAIGIGFNVNVFGNWYLQQKVGIGGHFIIPSNEESDIVNTITMTNGFTWEFMTLLNIGIVYKLKSA